MIALGRLLGALLFGTSASVTPSERPKRGATLAGYTALQDTTLRLADIRPWLEGMGVPGAAPLRGGGGGALLTAGRLALEGSGSGSGGVHETESGSASYGMGQGALDLGVMLVQKRFLRIYTLAGVGGMGGGVALRPREGKSTPDSTGWGSLLLRGGIGIDLRLPLWHVGLMVGLRLGYQSAAFHVQQGEGPELPAPTGWFFRVVTGPFVSR
ncbi:MAG: hypothetical protein KatS3mg051_0628 [Anaerolineae bacterium]|nr:MAG: hypothetical protein KatS3mg051_0628 [Anaerolineae bacterium]